MDRLHDLFGDSLAIIRYHCWWPDGSDPFYLANPTESRDRIYYLYDHQQNPGEGLYAPHFFVDMLFDADADVPQYENAVWQALAVPSLITMDLDVDLDFAARQLTVTCSGQSEATIPDALHLRCALIESDLYRPSASSFPFDQVMRDMVPTPDGVTLDLSTNQVFTAQVAAGLDPAWEVHNLEVVVFIQEDELGRVFQAATARMPAELPWFRLVSFEGTESGRGDGDGVINPGEDGTATLAVRADPDWGAVSNVTLTLVSLSDLITVTDGFAALPDMMPGDTAWVAAGQLGVSVSPEAELGPFPMELVFGGTFGSGDAYEQTIPVTLLVSINQPGFPLVCGAEVLSSPAVFAPPPSFAPGMAVAVADEAGFVHVTDGRGQYLTGFPAQAGSRASSSPAVVDLDGDGLPEILVGSWDNHLYCFNIDGTTRWTADLGGYVTGPVAVGDVNGDGALEIAAGTMSGDLWVLNADGNASAGWPVALGSTHRMTAGVCLADLDGDGVRDLVVGTWGKGVFAYRGDGSALPGWPLTFTKEVKAGVITATVATHGLVVLMPCLDDALHVVKPSGEEIVAIMFEGDLMTTPAVSDLDGDGTLEIIATAANGWVHVLDFALQEMPGWPVSIGARSESSPVVADVDGDGVPEILVGADDGNLRVFTPDGSPAMEALNLGFRIRSTPGLADLDDDGDIDLVVGAGTQIAGLDFKAQGGSVAGLWSQFRGVATRTGDYLDLGAVSTHPSSPVPAALALRPPQPNPAAHRAWVTMDLPRESMARLDIFDVAGRRVNTPMHASMPAGTHRVAVDVSGLSQGVYFLRLSTAQSEVRRPLVVLK
ncbi:VCBS repeat-containing protein [Candidatus Fermentibacteria bacterium]|nr:VCBS repeat-containing protein [Candidatus Fermentibacteria bacterium]